MAAKKKEIRKVVPSVQPEQLQRIVRIQVPQKAKQTQLISGSAADVAKQLVAKLRDEARAL
jgi:hypothetical protein